MTATIDCKEVMTAAWVIVRRFKGNGEPLRALLSRALKSAWFDAKMKARVAHASALAAQKRAALADRPAEELKAEIADIENRDYLGHEGQSKLSDLRAAHLVATQREEEEQAKTALDAKRKLISSAKGRFCSVTFTKKDGSVRTMRVQPAKLQYHCKGEAAPESARRAAVTRAQRHPHLLPVWDSEKAAPRSVNLSTISRIAVNGAVHDFA